MQRALEQSYAASQSLTSPPTACTHLRPLHLPCPPTIHADTNQQKLYAQYEAQASQRKIARTQEQCRKKLTEVHEGYLKAKRKFQAGGGAHGSRADDCWGVEGRGCCRATLQRLGGVGH